MGLPKTVLKKIIPNKVLQMRQSYVNSRPLAKRNCPICGYYGWFGLFGKPPRLDAECSKCHSLERHRLFFLSFERRAFNSNGSLITPIIHFAPEPILERLLRRTVSDYQTADLYETADLKLNLERIDIADSSIGTVICNHVLEHVDDQKALSEIYRILTFGGKLIASVPIVEGWAETYENQNIISNGDRELHFGQHDHVRYYGRDFRDRVLSVGFKSTNEITAYGEEVIQYGLLRGEKIFVFEK